MASRLENIRGLRDAVVECGRTRWQGKSIKVRKKKSKKASQESFEEWMSDVAVAVEDICGMDMEILPEMPWREWYEDEHEPRDAAQEALRLAEMEGDDDELSEEELEELALKKSFKTWSKGLDTWLRKNANTTLLALKRAGNISSSTLQQMFTHQPTVEMAARLLIRAAGVGEERQRSSLRRRGFTVPVKSPKSEGRDVMGELDELMEELEISPLRERGAGVPSLEALMGIEEEADEEPAEPSPEPTQQPGPDDFVGMAADAVRETESRIESKRQEEASVSGGDFGRWGPATSAAGRKGSSLAAAVSKKTGDKYRFHQEGLAQSADVGSDLWFELEPKGDNPYYYLGIKIKGDKENPKWDVMVKKGKGLGSATSVGSVRGVETSGIAGAIDQIISKIKGKSGSKE